MTDPTEAVPGALSEALAQPPSMIHVAGDLVVNLYLPRKDSPFDVFLKSAVQKAERQDAKPAAATASMEDAEPLKILADGSEFLASDPRTDHVALRFPSTGWIVAVNALTDNGKPFRTQQDVEAAAKNLNLLGYNWELASDKVYERHVIDRRFWQPTLDKNLYPSLPTNDWYWTSTAVPGSSASAFYVHLFDGGVNDLRRGYSGFGLACCRARQ